MPISLVSGYLTNEFIPNCRECRDTFMGLHSSHFCDTALNTTHCGSQNGVCLPPTGGWLLSQPEDPQSMVECPISCRGCPTATPADGSIVTAPGGCACNLPAYWLRRLPL